MESTVNHATFMPMFMLIEETKVREFYVWFMSGGKRK